MNIGLAWITLLGLGQTVNADESAGVKKAAMKSYMFIKEDSDRFVGEGVAALSEFSGDSLKASVAAKERARGDLASNIQVAVSSETSERLQLENGKVSEDIRSESKSHTELILENVKYMEFKEFPDPGQVTVLASLAKEDYRRQLAGKAVRVYAPENGFRMLGGVKVGANIGNVGDAVPAHFWGPGGSIYEVIGFEMFRNGWVGGLELEGSSHDDTLRQDNNWDPKTGGYSNFSPGYSFFGFSAGRDYTPWKGRRQIYFPMRLQYAFTHIEPFNRLDLFGGSAGLGYRFWPTDGLALNLQITWTQGFNSSPLVRSDGSTLLAAPGKDATLDMTGLGSTFGITWSGF
jgi:hypothetical protein